MSFGSVPSFFRIFTVSVAVLFVMQLNPALVAQASPGGTDFDIPISELNKVKKKNPVKRVKSEHKKKKKSAKSQESSSKTAEPGKPDGQADTAPAVSIGSDDSGTTHAKSPDVNRSEDTVINHFPYSFIVADKQTVISSVINSRSDIKEVTCSISTNEGGAKTLVKMEKVDGTHFTYKATLPPLPLGSTSLRYTIDVVDSQGRNMHSKEFVTPVTVSPVVPSWQFESVGEIVRPEKKSGKESRKDLPIPTSTSVQAPN